jgi:hypothetical protein
LFSKRIFDYRSTCGLISYNPLVDTRFFDLLNIWYRFDSGPLKGILERFSKFPIAISLDEKSSFPQPRLLLVSVDMGDGAAVTFDRANGRWF